ncbi:MAG: bifunctional 3-(3-hydroxy-phenyl)propionate/3-hydroxycinnamic acid hydroxylase MhpA [Acidimicrobiales bacterium]
MTVDTEVAIVGYGPVGNTLAILLAQLGHSVVVLERRPEPYPLPRAVHFDNEVGRILQACGMGAELRSITEPVDTYEWRNGRGATLLRFGRSGHSQSGWPLSSMFNQPALEELLDRRACALPGVEVRRGVEVTALEQGPDDVTVHTAGGEEIRARYVVGCDGANSTVRQLLGIPVCDLGFFYDWLVVDVLLDEPRVFDPPNLQVCDPGRPTTVVCGGPGRRRWEFMRLPHETVDELTEEIRAWELLASWDVRPDNARMERHAMYTFRARYAERWRAGRVLLAGDAAHLMPPFAGQGMCAGIRDAANLAWKLDLVLAGHAPGDLLDTYEQERLPSARRAIEFSIELGKVICVLDPAEAAARDEAMSAAVGDDPMDAPALPGIAAGVVDDGSPGAGEFFAQPKLDGGLFDDVHGVGWRLVSLGAPEAPIDAAAREWFDSIGGRCVTLHGCDELTAWSEGRGVAHVLQRPDFHVYGTASDGAGASALLRRLRGDLQDAPSLQGARS